MPRVKKHRNWVQFFFQRPSLLPFCREESEDFRSIIYQICKLSQKVQRVFTPNKATSQAWQLEKDWQKRRDDTKREERGGVKITHDSSQYTIFLCIVLLPLSLFVSNAIFLIWIWSYMYNNRKIFISFQYFTGKEIRIYVL